VSGQNEQPDDIQYELSVSRIFMAPRAEVSRALTDSAVLPVWSGPAGLRLTPAPVAANFERLEGSGPRPGSPVAAEPGLLRIELYDEPDGKTRLELLQGPYTEDQEANARAWWDRAFSRLDDFLARGGG
jgi:uncharacterized protein YndB with AHSA1/START domain